MTKRFLVVMALALLLQGTVFAIYYDDLLFFRQPMSEITSGSVESFADYAASALDRSHLTVKHLDTIAAGALSFGLRDVEVAALQRRLLAAPADRSGRLRLADALRRAGRLAEAEAIYLDILASTGGGRP